MKMKFLLLILSLLCESFIVSAQKFYLRGSVRDAFTNEGIEGACGQPSIIHPSMRRVSEEKCIQMRDIQRITKQEL